MSVPIGARVPSPGTYVEPRDRPPRCVQGRHLVAGLLIAALALVGVGFVLGYAFQSPEEASLRRPPQTIRVTEPVRREVLRRMIVSDATLQPTRLVSVAVPENNIPIVTAVFVSRGEPVEGGQRLIELAGKPTFLMAGEYPAWRDFAPGMTPGRDVSQLQEALAQIGVFHGQVSGEFDGSTVDAVDDLYRVSGYPPPGEAGAPASSFAFLPGGAGLVHAIRIDVGDQFAANALQLATTERRVEVSLSRDQIADVRRGMPIILKNDQGKEIVESTVIKTVQIESDEGETSLAIYLANAIPVSAPTNLTATLIVDATKDPVLSVPAVAVQERDGRTNVVLLVDGQEIWLPVTTGLVTGRRVEVRGDDPRLNERASVVLNPEDE